MGYPLLVLILPHASSNWDPRLLNKICKYLESKILTWSSFATSRGWLTAESIGLSGRFIQFNYHYLFYIHENPAARCCNFSLSTVNNNYAGNYVELMQRWDNVPEFDCRYWQGQAQHTAALPISSISINEQGSEGCCNSYRTLLTVVN